ncbi:molybdenum cofactor biosynthesis protein B [Brevundimonas goettingensis]|uniref:Molybdenum cofactor biosynthesis protein B n=1 Tax=Brevundimonas goettingensis TaxID=2774190 RepID=A0A975GV77_9CAUL|nr:molybdenum cofactor biosynthesis protein B [Brevundimonas goettingensis]QTC91092.1 molybdenum cofactor biosynthesis protein B [Brevundimonas goettingensis]
MTETLPKPVLPAPGGKLIDAPLTVVRIGVLTISDTRDEESDTSGGILADRIVEAGHDCAAKTIVPDDIAAIRAQVRAWISAGTVDAIITTGGTGLTGRDVTPEALEPLFDKRIDGFSVIFHQVSYQTVGLSTLQSRATAGIIDGVFVFCLPGSNGAVRDGWDKVIRWQLDSRHKPCNMVELMPRLLER